MSSLLVLGAKSDIARATAERFARAGWSVVLAARKAAEVADDAANLRLRYNVEAEAVTFDAVKFESHAKFYQKLSTPPDLVLVAFGYLGDQSVAQSDFAEIRRIIESNYSGAVSILELAAADMEERGAGGIIAISSVAGDRGRQSNYLYGSAKAALSAYLSGLRNRLARSKIHVMTVKPGFVRTQMTAGMELPGALTANADQVANDIFRGWGRGRNVLYTRWFWRFIMLIIIHIPEPIFKKLKL